MFNAKFIETHERVFAQIDSCGPLRDVDVEEYARIAEVQIKAIKKSVKEAQKYIPPPPYIRPGKWVMVRFRNNKNWGLFEVKEVHPVQTGNAIPFKLKLRRILNGKKTNQVNWYYPCNLEEITEASR